MITVIKLRVKHVRMLSKSGTQIRRPRPRPMQLESTSDYEPSQGLRPIKTLHWPTFQNAVIHEHLPRVPWGDSTTWLWPLALCLSVSLSLPRSFLARRLRLCFCTQKLPCLPNFPGQLFVNASSKSTTLTVI